MRNIEYRQIDKGKTMNVTRTLHTVAGAFILISLVLAQFVSPKWLYFTAFVGLNLFQSGFSNWCMMSKILKKLGVPQ